jgi:hypothetical protein
MRADILIFIQYNIYSIWSNTQFLLRNSMRLIQTHTKNLFKSRIYLGKKEFGGQIWHFFEWKYIRQQLL